MKGNIAGGSREGKTGTILEVENRGVCEILFAALYHFVRRYFDNGIYVAELCQSSTIFGVFLVINLDDEWFNDFHARKQCKKELQLYISKYYIVYIHH